MATASVPTRPVRRSRSRPVSTRLVRAAVLLGLAAVVAVTAVGVAVVTGSGSSWLVAGGLVVLALGAAATRSTHQEVLATRKDAGTDRARVAKQYRTLTDDRVAENTAFAATMTQRVEDGERAQVELLATIQAHEAALDRRERRLATVETELEQTRDRLAGSATLAREQAARAVQVSARVAELETERDALRSELQLWQAAAGERRRQA